MSNIQAWSGAALPATSRPNRPLSKALERLSGETSYDLAKIEAVAEVQAVKTDAVTYVAGRAMHSVTMVSTLEAQLALACPQASGRLALIADMTSLSLADLVQQTAHRVRSL